MALLTCGRGQWLAHGVWQTDRWAARCLSSLRLTTLIRMDVTILRGRFVSVAPAWMLFLVHRQPWMKCLLIVSRCHTLLSVDVIISGAVWIWMKHDVVTYSSRLHAHMEERVSSCLNKSKTDCVQMQGDNVAIPLMYGFSHISHNLYQYVFVCSRKVCSFSASDIVTSVDGKTSHWILYSNYSQLVSRNIHSSDLFTTLSRESRNH